MDVLRPPFDTTISALLLAHRDPEQILLFDEHREWTVAELTAHAKQFAAMLSARGVRPGDPVATMLGNGPNHVALFLGMALAGALWVPVNPEARGPSLDHVFRLTRPVLAFAGAEAAIRLVAQGLIDRRAVIHTDCWNLEPLADPVSITIHQSEPDDVRAILFTSGTSGPPKGVQVTERMLAASAAGTAFASDCHGGDRYMMWEPLHHIGGSQLLVMALGLGARLFMVERFSASRFWPQVRRHAINKLHYLGGILEILLNSPPGPQDRDHPVQLAFGGGCRADVWRDFEGRFGIPIREVYGMTEASSFTTVNTSGLVGSVGASVPWLAAEIIDQHGLPAGDNEAGEIVAVAKYPGLFTPGYLHAPEVTARLLNGGRLHSGDLGRRDRDGNFQYIGRMSDSLRRRGENISAWEVETALSAHPDIAESAVVGVPATIGEHDILCFVVMRQGCLFDLEAMLKWCMAAMPPHHVPRFWKQVEAFERTPSQRIRKDLLDKDIASAIDTAPPRDRLPHR